MIRGYRRLVAFLDEREGGEALALFRMATALALLVNLLATAADGVLPAVWLDVAHGGYRALGNGPDLVRWLGGPRPEVVWGTFFGTVAAGALLFAGFGGRTTALLAAQGFFALSQLNGHARGSYDALLSNALWLVFLANSTATWSLDAKLRRGRFAPPVAVTAWPRRLAVVQLVVVYFATGLHKVSAYWTPAGGFSALYFILQQPNWHRFDLSWTAHVYPLTQAATAAVWCFELGAPLLLVGLYWERSLLRRGRWVQRLVNLGPRRLYAAFGLMMHTGILVLLEVGPFFNVIGAFYVALFRPDEVRRAARLVQRSWSRWRTNE